MVPTLIELSPQHFIMKMFELQKSWTNYAVSVHNARQPDSTLTSGLSLLHHTSVPMPTHFFNAFQSKLQTWVLFTPKLFIHIVEPESSICFWSFFRWNVHTVKYTNECISLWVLENAYFIHINQTTTLTEVKRNWLSRVPWVPMGVALVGSSESILDKVTLELHLKDELSKLCKEGRAQIKISECLC